MPSTEMYSLRNCCIINHITKEITGKRNKCYYWRRNSRFNTCHIEFISAVYMRNKIIVISIIAPHIAGFLQSSFHCLQLQHSWFHRPLVPAWSPVFMTFSSATLSSVIWRPLLFIDGSLPIPDRLLSITPVMSTAPLTLITLHSFFILRNIVRINFPSSNLVYLFTIFPYTFRPTSPQKHSFISRFLQLLIFDFR